MALKFISAMDTNFRTDSNSCSILLVSVTIIVY